MGVDDDLAALRLDPKRLEPQALGERTPSNGDQHNVGLDRLRLAACCRLDRHLDARARLFDLRHLVAEVKREALLFQRALHQLGDLAVDSGQDAVEKFDHGHLGSQAPPDRAELEPDDAGADDDQLSRRQPAG